MNSILSSLNGVGIVMLVLAALVIFTVFKSVCIVPQGYKWVVQRLGKYQQTLETGVYAKGRLGIAKNEIDADYTDKLDASENENFSYSDTGVAGGLGIGYNITPMASIEAMYNFYPTIEDEGDDLDTDGITVGAHYKF